MTLGEISRSVLFKKGIQSSYSIMVYNIAYTTMYVRLAQNLDGENFDKINGAHMKL